MNWKLILLIFSNILISEDNSFSQAVINQYCFGGTQREFAGGIEFTQDNSIIFTGTAMSIDGDISCNHGWSDVVICKLDSFFNFQWSHCFGGSDPDASWALDVYPDGSIIFGGSATSMDGDVNCFNHGYEDFWFVKLDISGNILWQKCYGGSDIDRIEKLHITPDGGIIAAGSTYSIDGDVIGSHGTCNGCSSDFWIVKLDSLGNLEWNKAYWGVDFEDCQDLIQTNDNSFIACGRAGWNDGDVTGIHGASEDFWIIKIDSLGNLIWQKHSVVLEQTVLMEW